jgi:hypothetical protein
VTQFEFFYYIKHTSNILVGKPEGKRPLGNPRDRWEDKTRMGRKV